MLEMQQGSIFEDSPSFNSYSSNKFAEIAAKVSEEFRAEREEFGLEAVDESESTASEMSIIVEEDLVIPERSTDDLEIIIEEEEKKNNKNGEDDVEEQEGEEEDDFEFAFVCRDPDGSPITADEIFSNGQIRPIFPIFNRDLLFAGGRDRDDDDDSDSSKPNNTTTGSSLRLPLKKLFIEEREPHSSSSSEADELEALPDGTYCVWTPKPTDQASLDRSKKSSSTGSSSGSSRRWRFRDFLFRSNSDGKDTFVFLTPSASTRSKKRDQKIVEKSTSETSVPEPEKMRRSTSKPKVAGKMKGKGGGAAGGEVSAHEIHYIRNRALKEGDKRKSYLPYRQDLVGFFANVNGLSRNLQPF